MNAALGLVFEARDAPQQRGLAAARRPQKTHELTVVNIERYVFEGPEMAERFPDILNLQIRPGAAAIHRSHPHLPPGLWLRSCAERRIVPAPPARRPRLMAQTVTGSPRSAQSNLRFSSIFLSHLRYHGRAGYGKAIPWSSGPRVLKLLQRMNLLRRGPNNAVPGRREGNL
jgi:hypothetical protein